MSLKYVFIVLTGILLFFVLYPIFNLIITNDFFLFLEAIKDIKILRAILLSFECALYATICAFVLGIPFAYIVSRYNFFGRDVLISIINIPIIIPHPVAGIALLTAFTKNTLLGSFFYSLGISILDNKLGITLGMFFVSAPFFVNSAIVGFSSFDERIEKTARTLGANFFQTFFRISIPLSKDALVKGSIMMWARGISEFGAVVVIAYHPITSAVLIFDRFNSFGLTYSKPIASLLILISIAILLIIITCVKDKKFK